MATSERRWWRPTLRSEPRREEQALGSVVQNLAQQLGTDLLIVP